MPSTSRPGDALGAGRYEGRSTTPGIASAASRDRAATDGQWSSRTSGPRAYAYDVSGKPLWKVTTRNSRRSGSARDVPVLYRDLLVIIQRDEDRESEGRSWRTTRAREGSLANPTGRADHWSTPVWSRPPPHRAGDECRGVRVLPTIGHGQGAVARQGRRQQRDSHPAGRPRAGDRHRGLPREESHRAAARRRADDGAWLGVCQGHGLRALEHLYGDYVYLLTDNGS